MVEVTYHPQIFTQPDMDAARAIILNPEAGLTTDERWELETAWILERLPSWSGLVIDYGCGIGRLAKQLDVPVLGIDISPTMRTLALQHSAKPNFETTHPLFLQCIVDNGLRADGALAVWALQHCLELEVDCRLLYDALREGSQLCVVNGPRRYVPILRDDDQKFCWADDGKSVDQVLHDTGFTFGERQRMPEDLVQKDCFMTVWQR